MTPRVNEPAVPDEAWSPAARAPAAGSVEIDLPGYYDFALIARGGDSVVYRARQEGLNRLVAVKVLARAIEQDDDPSSLPPDEFAARMRRFQRELEITVRLGRAHPHIVTVLDTAVTGAGEPCIVMDYYDLGSLHDQVRAHGPLPASAAVAAGTVVADALDYAHGQDVLHRDVKPQNILVLPTSYVLADFGLARHVGTERSASLERFSYRHAAPQVFDGELPTAADDVYSLGSTLFTLLDGRPPFAVDDPDSDSALAYLRRVRTGPPRANRCPDAPAELLAIIDRCLAKRREDRFPDAASLRDALASVVTEARAWAPGALARTQQPRPPVPATADPPAGPAPLALSAIEHLTPGPARDGRGVAWAEAGAEADVVGGDADDGELMVAGPDVDQLATVAYLEDEQPTGAGLSGHAPDSEPGRASRPRRLLIRVSVALLLGGALGLGGAWLNGALTGLETPTGRPVPDYTGPPLPTTGAPLAIDPAIAPKITAIVDRGGAVELRWVDHSAGRATFVIIELVGDAATPVRQVGPGSTSVVVEGIDTATPRHCYQILSLTVTARAISEPECIEFSR